MSWLRGMLWKTPWKRKRTLAPQLPVSIRAFTEFFDGSQPFDFWEYRQPLVNPTIGQTAPYWVAMLGAAGVLQSPGTGGSTYLTNVWQMFLGSDPVEPKISYNVQTDLYPTYQGEYETIIGPVFASVILLHFYPLSGGLGTAREVWVDGALKERIEGGSFFANPAPVVARPAGIRQYLSSWGGGNAQLTHEEIVSWFRRTRVAREVQEISGKTLDIFRASSVPAGAAPALLPNLAGAGGQNMELDVQGDPQFTPLNVDVDVIFNY